MIDKAFKYRIYPTKSQKELLSRTFGCVRVIWNACVESFNSYDKELNPIPKMPGKLDLVEEKPWLNEVPLLPYNRSSGTSSNSQSNISAKAEKRK